jgi:hypothetical protein
MKQSTRLQEESATGLQSSSAIFGSADSNDIRGNQHCGLGTSGPANGLEPSARRWRRAWAPEAKCSNASRAPGRLARVYPNGVTRVRRKMCLMVTWRAQHCDLQDIFRTIKARGASIRGILKL